MFIQSVQYVPKGIVFTPVNNYILQHSYSVSVLKLLYPVSTVCPPRHSFYANICQPGSLPIDLVLIKRISWLM